MSLKRRVLFVVSKYTLKRGSDGDTGREGDKIRSVRRL